ncbi:MAG: hypothetical protein AB7L09_02930 [Nitrospira sp.]
MKIAHILYDKVTITYDKVIEDRYGKPNCKEEVWQNTGVYFKVADGVSTLELHGPGDAFLLLGRAKVMAITPWSAKFEAYWWKSHPMRYNKDRTISKRQKSGFAQLVRAEIVCEL